MSKPFQDALKEAARVIVLAVIPVLISFLENMKFDWRILAVTAGIAFLKFVDKYLHSHAKEQPEENRNEGLLGVHGLTGF